MKKLSPIIFALILAVAFALPSYAANDAALDAANTLYDLGLFTGSGTNADGTPKYNLDSTLSRQEAVTLLVRLLGKEEEAKSGEWEIPFTDVDAWAMPYVGYAYNNGLASGMSTKFGASDNTNAAQFLTFILRALGYSSSTDFAWDSAWELTDKLGITNGEYNEKTASFRRSDVVKIAVAALGTVSNDGDIILLDKLVSNGAVSKEAAETSGILDNRYVAYAKYMLSKDVEPVNISIPADGKMKASMFSKYFDNCNIYGRGEQSSAMTKAVKISLISNALVNYYNDCLDLDYDKTPSTTFQSAIAIPGYMHCNILTDGEGKILGYVLRDGKTIKFFHCEIDSRPLIDPEVAEFRESFESLINVPCEDVVATKKMGNQYICEYTFTDIPENAKYIVPIYDHSKSKKYIESGFDIEARVHTFAYKYPERITDPEEREKNNIILYDINEPYIDENAHNWDNTYPGYIYTIFLVLDAEENIIGYSLGVVEVKK